MATTAQGPAGILDRNEKRAAVLQGNILTARMVSDTILTSLGPRGMDKMIEQEGGGVVITNDGATILAETRFLNPCAKMMVELSRSQDVAAGDGTTTVVIYAGALLEAAQKLLERGLHAQVIAKALVGAEKECQKALRAMARPIDATSREALLESALISLHSKIVSDSAPLIAGMAVDAMLAARAIRTAAGAPGIELRDVKIVCKLGGTIEDSSLVRGAMIPLGFANKAPGLPLAEVDSDVSVAYRDLKVAVGQFSLAAPKTDVDNAIALADYAQMDRLLREERRDAAKRVKALARAGVQVLVLQKALKTTVSDLALDFCTRADILVIRDVPREELLHLSRQLGVAPAADLDQVSESIATVELITEERTQTGPLIKLTGLPHPSCSVLLRASNALVLKEAKRSLHDCLCVVNCLFQEPSVLPGGAAVEAALRATLALKAKTLDGRHALCWNAFAEAFTVPPTALAHNSALDPLPLITQLDAHHRAGRSAFGIDVKKNAVADMFDLKIVSPLTVFSSAVALSVETVTTILKIDDVVLCR